MVSESSDVMTFNSSFPEQHAIDPSTTGKGRLEQQDDLLMTSEVDGDDVLMKFQLFDEQRNIDEGLESELVRDNLLDEPRDTEDTNSNNLTVDFLSAGDLLDKQLEDGAAHEVTDEMDEIEAVRIKHDDNDNKDIFLENRGIELLLDGTQERNEQEEFQLQLAKTYFDKGLNHWTNSNLGNAMREFARGLEIREDICGRKDRETAQCYLWVGTIHFLQNAWDRALDDFCRCFRIQYELSENKADACHVATNWINKCLDALGLKDETKKSLFWKKFMTCIDAEQRGDSLTNSGKYERAIENYRTALQFEYHRRNLNPTTPGRPLADCADMYYKIGRCYQLHGNHYRAIKEYRQAFTVYMAKFGLNHRHTVTTMEHMADTFAEMGFQASVADEYVDAIHKSVRHEQTGDWMMNNQNDPTNALKEYEVALQIEGGIIGKTQLAYGVLCHKVSKVYTQLMQPKQALLYSCQALAIFEPNLGAQHNDTVAVLKLMKESLKLSEKK